MDNRLQSILQLLISSDEPMSSSQLSLNLQVSSKTVRNDIKELNHFLQKIDMQIVGFRGKGYKLKVEDEEKLNKFLDENMRKEGEAIPSHPGDRVKYLIESLLLSSDYIKIEELEQKLFISRSTLQGDLKNVRKILEVYNLKLINRPYYGLKVIGDETKIRYCSSQYIFNQNQELIEESPAWHIILPEEDLKVIKNSILKNIRQHKIIISDISLHNLIMHVAIACRRIRENHAMENFLEESQEIRSKKEFIVAKQILKQVEEIGVCFNEKEIMYLAIHLLGTRMESSDEKAKALSVIDEEIFGLSKEIVKRIDKNYNFNLSEDQDLLLALSLHLKPVINRYKYQMNLRNPLLEDIKTKYPLSFEAALAAKDILYEKYELIIDENEIGYLALHIEAAQERLKNKTRNVRKCLIVCGSGLGSAQLLLYKLKDKFRDDLEVIGTTEYYNLNQQSLKEVDFIVSTIPIQEALDVPVIYVNTILSRKDINKIESVLSKGASIINNYLLERYTFLNVDFETPKEVIRYLCDKLLEDYKIDEDYVDSVLQRERYAPTSFGNLIAIPHPLEPKTKSTFWSIATLNKPILWGDKQVQIVILINIKKGNQDLCEMYQILVRLLDNMKLLLQLLECTSFEQFRTLMDTV
ncbi:BglG family transcription antiterminator [Oceanobacillus profundus]|uniref:BglG family transcription antiterminator n=1 Tax=Oceanobacillus profundus TaxID=372463 RepID=UPI00363EE41E